MLHCNRLTRACNKNAETLDSDRANGLDAWAQVVAHGWEGLVAKDEASPYVPEARTRRWIKVAPHPHRLAGRGG